MSSNRRSKQDRARDEKAARTLRSTGKRSKENAGRGAQPGAARGTGAADRGEGVPRKTAIDLIDGSSLRLR
jgi:hypothetical protein